MIASFLPRLDVPRCRIYVPLAGSMPLRRRKRLMHDPHEARDRSGGRPAGTFPAPARPALASPRAGAPRRLRRRTLERRLFAWLLVLTLVPALALLAAGAWGVGRSLGVAGALGPWEAVAATGLRVVELAEPGADPELAEALSAHRAELSSSLTQARRWAFLGQRFADALPWLALAVAVTLIGAVALVSRHLARQLARPIRNLVAVAGRMGSGDPLPPPAPRTVLEVHVLDEALRDADRRLVEARGRAIATERLRVWGEMARRVAHEMKNPLTPLRLAAHRLARAPVAPGAGELRDVAEVIDQEVRRLEELAAQFGALGRPSEGPAAEVDVAELLRSLLETDVRSGVATTLTAPPDVPPVRAHFDPLLRAFRNVIRNAEEAMDGIPDPRLDVRLQVAPGRDGDPDWLEVRVADSGPGLPEGYAGRIFEPDFTTKTRGTGLGLALVRQAVEADGGRVLARNRREGGAEFVLRLPVAADLVRNVPEKEP
jgi:signal transduction histidine kinase